MPETHISIKSEVKKIDDRNVVLNYYSDVLETYIDMELPADTYNFLQTYIPDKKYSIVLELEKQSAVQQHKEQIESGIYLNKPEPEARIETQKDEIDDVLAKIKKVAELKDLGILTEEEFAAKKAELLSKI